MRSNLSLQPDSHGGKKDFATQIVCPSFRLLFEFTEISVSRGVTLRWPHLEAIENRFDPLLSFLEWLFWSTFEM